MTAFGQTPAVPLDQTAAVFDDVDARLVAALQNDARATWGQLATVAGVSESTAMRRVQRLRESGNLLIIGVPDPLRADLGQPVLVHLRTRPGHTVAVAEAMAGRTDVRFVSIVSGRSDIICELIVRDRAHLSRILLEDLAEHEAIVDSTTSMVLKTFKTRDEWSQGLLPGSEDPTQRPVAPAEKPARMDHLDMALIAALGQDGRRSFVDLSGDLGLSETAVSRRLNALLAARQLSFATLVNPALLGFGLEVFVHLRVELSDLESVAVTLAGRPEVRYVSATAGYSDVICEAVFRDNDALYEFMTHHVGMVKGVRHVEVDTELRTIKRVFRHPLFVPAEHTGTETS
jgi:DNA-binding Lrp family transcriptional regulator